MSEQQEVIDNQLLSPPGIIIYDKYIFDPALKEWTNPETGQKETSENWSVKLAFPPEADLSKLEQAAEAKFKQAFPKDRFNSIASPFKPYSGNHESIGDDWIQVNFSTYQRPQVVDRRSQPIAPNSGGIYSGCRAVVICVPKVSGGNNGYAKKASFILTGIQVIEKLDPHWSGSDKPKENFDPSKHFVNMDEAGEDAIAESMF